MKPVIIHVVQHLKPGGIESFALEFQRAAKECFDVHIISLEKHSFTSCHLHGKLSWVLGFNHC